MKKPKIAKLRYWHYIILSVLAVLLAGVIAGNVICYQNAQAITNLLCGTGTRFDGEEVTEALAMSDEFVQQTMEEGVAMLKNDNGVLPLSERRVNLFGWASTDNGFLYTGTGSGAGGIAEGNQSDKRITPQAGFTAAGFEVNTDLINAYTAYYGEQLNSDADSNTYLAEPPRSFYDDKIDAAKAFSDVAIVTFARFGGEGREIPYTQSKRGAGVTNDETRHYLELSTEEEDLLDLVTNNFDKVVVLLNLCNPMEVGFLDNEKIDAALMIGLTGQSGIKSVARILKGEVNPSGRIIDTFVYDFTTAASYANNRKNGNNITYTEDIYIGYKWYETANAEGFWDSDFAKSRWGIENGYEDVVKYPFGYGLSYTTFGYEVKEINVENAQIAAKNTQVKVVVTVTNTGSVAGKEVVQLYVDLPYEKGGIEKPSTTLVAFAKTALLEPGVSQEMTLTFDLYDIASYDCYDKNENGITSWELEAGEYKLKLMKNAHDPIDCEKAVTTFTVTQDLNYKLDPTTKRIVKNRFTGDTAYANVPIDASTVGSAIKWVSRENFADTFPTERTATRNADFADSYTYDGYDNVTAPTQGVAGDLRIWTKEDGSDATREDLRGTSGATMKLNTELLLNLAQNYNSETWERFLNQITPNELYTLVECSGYGTYEMLSIGKAFDHDADGPSGFRTHAGTVFDTSLWSCFPAPINYAMSFNEQLSFQYGRAIGNEANVTGLSGWYAPAVNMHRSPFNGRYFEYYSEDGLVSGMMAAQTIYGAKTMNTYAYLKHFALSEMGINPQLLDVWCTEQALRETYLKPFEIAVKKGGANALMTAFNNVGATWSGASKPLLTDILRGEWGFKGVIITDWSRGGGIGGMNPTQGLRAGNDMWLNPNNWNGNPLARNDTDLYLARNSAHNMLWTIADTYKTYSEYDASDDPFTATIGITARDEVFAWWIPVLIVLDVLVVAAIAMTVTFILIPKRKKAAAASGEEMNAEPAESETHTDTHGE